MNDGDTALVCADEVLVEVAKRNVEKHNVVPLYYHMAKANSVNLSKDEFYNGMISAYSGGNIGAISNDITKVWNSENPNLDAIKYMCMMSNFTIDFAKTLYKPEVPSHIKSMLKEFTRNKTPHFFRYAKNKEMKQVEKINSSVVNRLNYIVKDKRFHWDNVALDKFDYKMLMSDKYSEINQEIVDEYERLKREAVHMNIDWSESKGMPYAWVRLRDIMEDKYETIEIVDTLVLYLLKDNNQRTKKIFFGVFADVMVENLKINITKPLGEYVLCGICGKRIKKENNKTKYCIRCSRIVLQEQKNKWKRQKWNKKEEK